MLYLKGIIGSPHNFIASWLTLRNLPNVAPIMVREAKVDKPETVMLYLKGNIGFTYNTIAFTAIAKYAITATANLLAFE